MNAGEFPAAASGVGVTSPIEAARAQQRVVRNSRFLIAVTMTGAVFALIMSACMVLVVVSMVFPTSAFTAERGWAALRWVLFAFAMGSMGPWLWKLARAMAFYRVVLDHRGVDFHMGTKKAPQDLFMAWDQIAAIRHTRLGNNQIYSVKGTDGSEATFTSYTFFRPKKLARLIAERAGLAIQNG
jgi:hypothetical protein